MSGYSMCELCSEPITDQPHLWSTDGEHVAHTDCVDDLALQMADEVQEQRIGETR